MDTPDLPGLVSQATQPEQVEAGPGDVRPTIQTKGDPKLVTLPMTDEQLSQWWKDIEAANARIDSRKDRWDILLKEYLPVVVASGTSEALKVGTHFRNVHTKLGQMFYRSPELFLTPDDPSPAQNQIPNPMAAMQPGAPPFLTMEDIISVKQAVLNKTLGRDGIKANRLMDELLFDVLAWAGFGVAKLGYRCTMKAVKEPVMQPAPPPPMMFPDPSAPPAPLEGAGAPVPAAGVAPGGPSPSGSPVPPPPPMVPVTDPNTGEPMTRTVNVPIHEEWYARRFSPKKFLCNADLKSGRFDEDATFMGMHFYMSPKAAMKPVAMGGFGLTEDDVSKAQSDDRVFQYEEDKQSQGSGLIHGIEITCKASYFTDEAHPLAMCQLILIDGIKDRPLVWRMSPDQTMDPNTGQLSKDSLIGFPFIMLNIRDLADTPFAPSDAAFANAGAKELNTYRRQSVQIRDAQIGKYLYDGSVFDEVELPALKDSPAGTQIAVTAGALANGVDKVYASTTQINRTVDDYRGQDIIKRDLDEMLGISANQAGVESDTIRTATETATVQSGANARAEKERGRVIDFYLDLARKIDQLLMRYADANQYVEMTGQDGAKRMQVWNSQMISGKFLYEIAPDSQIAPDNAQDFKSLLDFYNLAAQDPLFNRAYVLKVLARMKGLDPSKVVLNPMQVPTQVPHGGGEVNQHMASNSGNRPNEPGAGNRRQEQPK